jgi:hypothetical protein
LPGSRLSAGGQGRSWRRVAELRRDPVPLPASLNKWWFDELNDLLFIRIGGRLADALVWFDVRIVDGTSRRGHRHPRRWRRAAADPDGPRQNYALGIAIGLTVVAAPSS